MIISSYITYKKSSCFLKDFKGVPILVQYSKFGTLTVTIYFSFHIILTSPIKTVPSQTLERQTLDTTNPRHD